ncbi:PFAM Enoyl-CoA hydratase isomerase [Mactra antiquata]
MADCLVLSFEDDGFATIRMINGENRFRLSFIEEWNEKLDSVVKNEDTKALLITGEGRFFSNGIDLAWLSTSGDDSKVFMEKMHTLFTRVLTLPFPTVALINGHAFGAGAFLALACDYRVMRPDKGWLNWPETAINLRFGGPLLRLARAKIPPGIVQREALLFAKRLTGEQAKRFDLVDAVVEEGKMVETGKELAKRALGRNGLGREIVFNMKKDIYGKEVDMSKL